MKLFFFVPLLFVCNWLFAQYTVNGNASANNCHCYTLTPNANNQSGSVWNNFKIDLTQSFDFNFDINLGCNDGNGADGIVFVLQPISTSVGSNGGGLGFSGISPSVGVTIDTWQNTEVNDPAYDHIAIQLNGQLDHSNTAANIAGPVTALNGNDNIEDCQWHTFRIKWDAATTQLTAYIDGNQRVSTTRNLVSTVFSGNPNVFWGFTAGTGGSTNLQQFCTALSPKYNLLPDQKRCINEPITFYDTTVSFTSVLKRYWNFGDGSNIDSVNLNPTHTYTTAGNYSVIQTVLGADGCTEVNMTPLLIGSKPIPDFTLSDSCINNPINFADASSVAFGSINTWSWDFGVNGGSTASSGTIYYNTGGNKTIKFFVETAEGCISDTLTKTIHIYSRPVLDFTFNDSVCLGATTNFNGTVVSSSDPIQAFAWIMGDDIERHTQNISIVYQTPGPHNAMFVATSSTAGCLGIIEKTVFVRSKPIAAFKNDFVCQSVTTSLLDSSYTTDGSPVSRWWWDTGNGISLQQNPSVTYNTVDTIPVKLVVKSGACISDTLTKQLIVAAKPIVDFSYTGNGCENQLMQFSDSSKVQNGSVAQWSWLYQNNQWSTEQNPTKAFSAGNQTVSLEVISDKGCKSSSLDKTFLIISKPLFDINFNEACAGSLVNFSATDISGGIQNWQWNFGDNSTAAVRDTQHIYSNAGTYHVILSVEAGDGCTNTDSSHITIYGTNASIDADTIIAAANQPIQLNATGGGNYEWSPANGLNNITSANPIASNTENQQYIVRAYTPVGCDSYDTVVIRIFDGPQIYVPTAFNPLSNVGNNIFRAIPVGITTFKYFIVYNRLGEVVFSTSNPQQGWDGNFKGKPQPAAAYVWIAAGTTFRGTEIVRKGTVVLVR
jgi:PKD repeat protein